MQCLQPKYGRSSYMQCTGQFMKQEASAYLGISYEWYKAYSSKEGCMHACLIWFDLAILHCLYHSIMGCINYKRTV